MREAGLLLLLALAVYLLVSLLTYDVRDPGWSYSAASTQVRNAGGTVGALLAGSLRWSGSRFVSASLIGVPLWCAYAGGLGYLGGALAEQSHLGVVISAVLALTVAVVIAAMFRRATSASVRA